MSEINLNRSDLLVGGLSAADYHLQIAGENAYILYLTTQQISPGAALHIQTAMQLLQPLVGTVLVELLPSYASLLITFNPLQQSHLTLRPQLVKALAKPAAKLATSTAKCVELPVWYSEQDDLDLVRVAKATGLSVAEVIALHSQCSYQVYAIGFAPGFAYLGELPAALALPRLSTPRAKVPAGAVAIADRQTAVYPAASPGGWHLLGLCPVPMFNAKQQPAMPVAVGDQVNFVPITARDYSLLGGLV
ncbi:5-oxoprolinase subunit B family protein [Alishewanella sp. HL-SH06]|uniref:5-oxoprolinase subunit B family protein n=1 Tax=Alishewanella sp. HL-SH06 TaxID=3461144 RepID=UPI0040421378